jgi:uncharacterized membrane-anchored protein
MNPVSPVNQSTSQSTSASASGIAGAAGVVLIWILVAFFKVSVPSDVAVAIVALLTPIIHYIIVRLTMTITTPTPTTTTPGVTNVQ